MGVLYEHWRPDTNECFYVGASWKNPDTRPYEMSDRNDDHIRVQEELAGKSLAPEVKVIDCPSLNDKELGELEILQISYWKDLIGDRLVNIAKGGWGVHIDWSDEMCAQMSLIKKEWWNNLSNEEKQKFSELQSLGQQKFWSEIKQEDYDDFCRMRQSQWDKMTDEQRFDHAHAIITALAALPSGYLSQKAIKWQASRTFEEKSQSSKKAQSKISADRKSKIAKERQAKKTPEQRSAATSKGWETRRAKAAQQQQVP